MNYDPNITWAKQTVKLTFGMWDARATMEVEVGGNCKGFDIFEAAIDKAYEKLDVNSFGIARLVMLMPDGDKLICEDDEDRWEDWLKRLCIGVEITAIRPVDRAAPAEGGAA